jgi:hypothetical protein
VCKSNQNIKLSIALFGRNDNYGEHWLSKLKLSILSLQRSLKEVDYEIVLLDYNPIKDNPLLSDLLPNSKYPMIKHFVFSEDSHMEFIECHLQAGAILPYKKKYFSKNKIKEIQFIGTFAANMAIKKCSGDYILSTGTDNIFPIYIKKFIDKIEKRIVYHSWVYKMRGSYKDIKKIRLRIFDKWVIDNKLLKNSYFKKNIFFNLKKNICSSTGNFILMDKESWIRCGGYMPVFNPRSKSADTQVVFNAMACGNKIKGGCVPIYNIDNDIPDNYRKLQLYSGYIVEKEGIKYDHQKEVRYGKHSKWRSFYKFASQCDVGPYSKEKYFLKLDYKQRLKDIQELFRSFLDEKFLLQ